MGPLRSRFVRRTLLALASVVAFVVVLVATAHLGFVRARVLDWARAQLSSGLGIVVDADTLRYNLLTLSMDLGKVRLSAPRDRPFLEADAIRIVLNRRALTGALELERLEIDRPRVTIVRHRSGALNLPASPEGPASAPTPIHLGRVALSAMGFEFEDEAAGHRVTAAPIDLTLDTRAGAAAPGTFGPTSIAVTIGSTDDQVRARSTAGTLAGRLGFDGSRVTLQEIRLDAPEGRLGLNGWVDVIAETVRAEAQAKIEADLAAAGRLAGGPAASLAGSATAVVELRGALADPAVTVSIMGRSLRFQSAPEVDLTAAATYLAGRVEIDRVTVSSRVGAIDVSGTLAVPVDGGATPRESRLTGRIEGVDIDRLIEAAGVVLPLQVGSTAAGRIDAVLDSEVPLAVDAWRQLNVSGSVQLLPNGSGLAIEGQLDLAMREGRWTIDHALRSPEARASLDGAVSGGVLFDDARAHGLSGSTRLKLEELHSLLPILRQAGVALPAPLDQIDGRVDARIEPRGALAAPTVHATIEGRGVRVPGIADDGMLNSTLAIDQTGLTAKALDARLGTLSLAASGAFTWREQVEGRFEATADDLSALAAAFGLESGVIAGSSEIKGSLRGTVGAPRAQAQLTARSLAAYGVAVGPVSAALQFADDRLDVDADAPDLAVRLKGGLGTREPFGFDAEAILERSRVPALLPAAQVEALPVDGTITATVRAKGDIRHLAEAAGQVELRALDASVAGVPVVLVAPGVVSLEPSAIAATPLRVRVGAETNVRLQGTLSTTSVREGIDVRVEGTLADLLRITAPARPNLPVEIESSRVNLDLHVGGTLAAPQPAGTLALEADAVRYAELPPATGVTLNARVEPSRIALASLNARWQGANLTASGEVPLRMIVPEMAPGATGMAAWGANWLASLPPEPRSGTLSARITGVTADALAPFVDQGQLQTLSGTIDATLSAEADRFSLDALQASVVLDRAALDLAGVPFQQSVPTRVRLERGQARVEELRWNAQGNELRASGHADLIGPAPTIELAVEGALDLRVLGAFAAGVASGGVAQTALTVRGPLASPQIVGGVDVESGELRLETPSISASDFYGSITVDAARNATVVLNGFVNGGSTSVWGGLALEDLSSPRGRLSLAAWNVMLEYPEGFQTESNADLALTLAPSASTLAGRIDVLSGIYREPIVVSQSLLAGFGGSGVPSVGGESSFLTNLRLDVTVATADDIRVDNNYGRLNLSANLQVTGSAARPGMVGRVEAEPDGEVYLAGNTYRVQTFTVDFNNPRTLAPDVTFLAETRVGNVPIEIALQCTAAGPCEREVRSQATGVSNEAAEGMLFGISADPEAAGAQLARLLSGELLGIVSGSIGLDTLRLEQGAAGQRSDLFDDPTLVAGDVNPASRLTVGKRLGDRVELAYSQDLADNGFVMSTTYFAPAGISFRALLLDNENRSYEFRHEPRIGARRRSRPAPRREAIVKGVGFSGSPGFTENELRDQLRLSAGDRFDFSAWQEDRERLRRFYQSRGFVESRVRARRTVEEQRDPTSSESAPDAVTLEYAIEQGPPTRLEVSGFDLTEDVRRRIVERWAGAVFDRFLERDVTTIVREQLYQLERLGATVTAAIATGADGTRTLRVEIDPGPATTPRLEIAGNESIATARLFNAAESLGPLAAWLDPAAVALAVERLYQAEGFLSANAEVLEPEAQGGVSVARVVIREGGAWQIGRVTVGGAELLSKGGTAADLGLAAGSRYDPAAIAESIAGLEQRFGNEGFLDVRVESETVLDQAERRADVHVLVAPGARSVLASIVVDGARSDNPMVARSLDFSVGGPVSASAIGAARRRLYETGVYRSVEISVDPAAGVEAPGPAAPGDRPVVVHVRVQERPRYSFRYGLAVNSDVIGPDERDTRLGFAADLENRNLFGRGLTLGLSARLRRDQEVARVYLGGNRFFGLPLRSNVFLSRSRQDIGSDAVDGSPQIDIVSDVTEISLEQTYRLRRFVDLRYGYGLGRNRTTIEGGSTFEVRVARLTTSGLVDRRDDPFDPTRGWFTSANFELSRPGLGSEISFLRSYLQVYRFTSVRRGLVVASTARVGMARPFRGEPLIPSERFFAGGATSVRGYRENDLGARSIFGDAEGGAALFVANGELRFPIYRWVRGVGFVDLGDVYPTVGDLLQSGVQVGAGGGIRLNTPVGLLRLDLAVPVNPRPFDPKWSMHFGLGHSF
jgi:outer membrane protein assembly factor BamA